MKLVQFGVLPRELETPRVGGGASGMRSTGRNTTLLFDLSSLRWFHGAVRLVKLPSVSAHDSEGFDAAVGL